MAEASISTSKLPIQCPVCLDTYDRPRTLPCLHSFCSSCLHNHVTNTAQISSFSSFLCPVCRANTRPPRPYSGKETWSEQFPVNHWILSVIEEATNVVKDEAVLCDTHPESKINLYCLDHEVVCCAICVAMSHRKCDNVEEITSILSSYDSKQVKTETLAKLKQSEEILTDLDAKCALADSNIQIDKDKMVNIIDTIHEDTVNYFEALKKVAIQNVEQQCKQVTNNIMTRRIICNKGKQTCKQVKEMFEGSSKDTSPIFSFIQIHAAKLKMKSIDLCVANHWTFNEANSLAFEVNEDFSNIRNITSMGNVRDTRQPDKKTQKPESSASKSVQQHVENTQYFTHDEHIPIRTSHQLHTFSPGTSNPTSPRKSETQDLQITSTNYFAMPLNSEKFNIPISRCTDLQYVMYSNNSLFKKHWISGLTFLHHGLLLLCNQTEKGLYLIKDNSVLYADRRVTAPWDVASYTENGVVVTYPQENTVRIFEVKFNTAIMKLFRRPSIIGRPLIYQRSFSTQEACFGVIFVSDRVILACEDCVKVYTITGRCMQIVKHTHRVEPLFGRVVDIAIDRPRSIMYATDEVNSSLLSFRLNEDHLQHQPTVVYKDPSLRCPRGVSVGRHGEVYVCGFVSKTLHIINRDGICNWILTTEQRPCGITIEQRHSLLAITFYPDSERRHTDSFDIRFYKMKRN